MRGARCEVCGKTVHWTGSPDHQNTRCSLGCYGPARRAKEREVVATLRDLHAEEIAKLSAERDAAIRERDEARAHTARLNEVYDNADHERDEAESDLARVTAKWERLREAVLRDTTALRETLDPRSEDAAFILGMVDGLAAEARRE